MPDNEAEPSLLKTAMGLIHDSERIAEIEANVKPLARLNAAQTIIDQAYKLV